MCWRPAAVFRGGPQGGDWIMQALTSVKRLIHLYTCNLTGILGNNRKFRRYTLVGRSCLLKHFFERYISSPGPFISFCFLAAMKWVFFFCFTFLPWWTAYFMGLKSNELPNHGLTFLLLWVKSLSFSGILS